MLTDILMRMIAGGMVVSLFAVLGDLLKPKTFAGLFGAAPSVALATMVFTIQKQGADYAAIEARSMIAGAVAFLIYALVVAALLSRGRWPAFPVTLLSMSMWFTGAFGFWFFFLR